MSGQASYDVYVKSGLDPTGRDEFGEAVAHFVERCNAVALKRRLVARGETVHVVRNVVHGLTETEKKRRFSDYHPVPEYNPTRIKALRRSLRRPLRTRARTVRFLRWVMTPRRLRERKPQDRGGEGGWVHRKDDHERRWRWVGLCPAPTRSAPGGCWLWVYARTRQRGGHFLPGHRA